MKPSWSSIIPVLAIVDIVLALIVLTVLLIHSYWLTFSVLILVGVFFGALHHKHLLVWLVRPHLQFIPFEFNSPFFIKAPEFEPNSGQRVGSCYYANFQIKNTGELLAKNCQAIVTAMGQVDAAKWIIDKDWVPLPLEWMLEESTKNADESLSKEKDLVPQRPYHVNLGCTCTTDPHVFKLFAANLPEDQKIRFGPGQYCFEISLHAEKARPVVKYFHIKWLGGCTDSLDEVMTKIKIFDENYPPWMV